MELRRKSRMSSHSGEFLTALLLLQPLLDVLSYFMLEVGATLVTTVLRFVLLFGVSLYGFTHSDRKRAYFVCWGVILGFWLLHMLNCLRTGYTAPLADTAEYLKLIQFPLWTLSFITVLRQHDEADLQAASVLAVDFGIILFVIALSFAVGKPVYTYDYPERGMQIGILGWFGVANAQSAILSMLAPPLLLWAYRKERLWLFCVTCVLGFGLLYFTGTRLTFYAALLTAGMFLVLILVGRRNYLCCLPLLAVIVLLLVFRGASPMAERQSRTVDSYAVYQEKTDRILGKDKDFVYREGEEFPAEVKEKIKRVYQEVYTGETPYGAPLLGDLIDRFGLDAVMEQYHYSTSPEVLYNGRVKKLTAMKMVWQEKDFLTKLTGLEYAEATIGGNIYDPENDFPALLYYNGYLGCVLYLGFAAYFVLTILIALLRDFSNIFTLETGTYAAMFALALGAAQFSGQVLRKPSVTVYLALAAAMLYWLAHPSELLRLQIRYDRSSVISVKRYD